MFDAVLELLDNAGYGPLSLEAVGRRARISLPSLQEPWPSEAAVVFNAHDWRIGLDTALEPDLMVIRRSDFAPDGPLVATPLLVVEVLSPSTRDTDLGSKRQAYADAVCPAYWIVNPAVPAVTALSLGPDAYADVLEATEPFAVAFCAAELAEG